MFAGFNRLGFRGCEWRFVHDVFHDACPVAEIVAGSGLDCHSVWDSFRGDEDPSVALREIAARYFVL